MSDSSAPKHVLVPIDGSPQSERAFDFALTFEDAKITLLTVIDPVDVDPLTRGYQSPTGVPGMVGYSEEWYEGVLNDADELHERLRERADDPDRVEGTEVVFGRPTRRICGYVADHDIDHVVMGAHGRTGITRVLLGNTAESVVRRSPANVTVIR